MIYNLKLGAFKLYHYSYMFSICSRTSILISGDVQEY